jgi:DNA-binding response OmpR family regulator
MPDPKILIIDDEPANVALLQAILTHAEYRNIRCVTDATKAVAAAREMEPDLVLLDLTMPRVSGYEVLGQLRAGRSANEFLPILILTADVNAIARRRALQGGASDFLTKPFANDEVLLRCKNLLEARFLHLALQNQNERLENQVQKRTAELERALASLKSAQEERVQVERLRALGEMSSGVALDFNNQLTVLIGYTDLLLLNNAQMLNNRPLAVHYLKTINAAARDSAGIVARLRDFHRSRDAGEVFLPINLSKLVQDTVTYTQPKWKSLARADGRQIVVRLELEPELPVCGNADELREALTGLIFNAVDAMPLGGIITLRTRLADGAALLEVIDTGIGMTADVRQRCLEPFYSTKEGPGRGLGLSAAYGAIKRHEGKLDIISNLGMGTTIQIRLPLSKPSGAAAEERPPVRPLRVLVVEEDPAVREVVSEYLRRDHHEVSTAVNGRDGLDTFSAGPFDLVVADLALDEMNGERLAMEIKERSPKMPVILLTGFGDPALASDELPSGANAVLRKPLAPDDLWRAVARVTGGKDEG